MERFTLENKQVELWPSEGENRPVIYLNTFEGEGERVWQEMRRGDLPDFSLAAVSGLEWNRDLSPWDAPAIYKGAEPFSGGAEAYLAQLTEKILPAVEQRLRRAILRIYLYGQDEVFRSLFGLRRPTNSQFFSRVARYLIHSEEEDIFQQEQAE